MIWAMAVRLALLLGAALIAIAALAAVFADGDSAPPPRPVDNRAFASAPGETPAEVWAVGDAADGSKAARRLARRVIEARPDRLLYLGDVYGSGTAEEFKRKYATVYGPLAGRTAPTPGNHDWPNHVDGYDPYWRRITGQPTPPWYAFRIGGWEVISLNSEAPHQADGEQLRWLRRQLREPGTCRLAFWHRPRFSAGRHGDQGDVQPFWEALRGRATLVVGGHDHNMQRFRPREGMTQLVAGAGGVSRYDLDDGDARLAFANETHDGALRLELQPGRAEMAFIAVDGRRLDRAAVRCRPLAR
jgi:acid phosphatase type 7